MKDMLKEDIVKIIEEEWLKSKVGDYLEKNQPQWIKDLVPEKYSFISNVANCSADRILKLK